MQADVWELLNYWHSDSVTSFLLHFLLLKEELSSNISANRLHMKKWLHRFPLVTFLYLVFDWSMTESSIKIILYHSWGLPQISRSRSYWTSVSCCKKSQPYLPSIIPEQWGSIRGLHLALEAFMLLKLGSRWDSANDRWQLSKTSEGMKYLREMR